MSNSWTEQQQQAIDRRGKNLLISAAAGSGKTAVLVERIVKLVVEERVSIDNMLIVTFTNAAAGEMKQRIQRRLQEIRRANGMRGDAMDRELADLLSKQIQNVPRASISTVHSFCIQVIRDHFSLAEIDPAFKLVNEAYGAILQDEAIDQAFEQKYDEEDPDFQDLVAGYGEAKGDRALRDLVKNIDRFIQAQPYPQEWLEHHRAFYEELASFDAIEDALAFLQSHAIGRLLVEWVTEQIEGAEDHLQKAWEEVEGKGYSFEDKLLAERDRIEDLKQASRQGLVELFGRLKPVTFDRFARKKSDEIEDDEWKKVQALRNEAKEIYNELTKKPILDVQTFLPDIKYLSRIISALIELVLAYRKHYAQLKQDNTVLDFSDLEHLTLKILAHEEVRESLRQKYEYIFYDEYQDTNRVQETIVNAICRGDNLFFVGDVKQSIYRFRLADPTIFNEKYERYQQDRCSEKIDLSNNFRSRREILDFCNLIFTEVMTTTYGEVDYKSPSHQLYCGQDLLKKAKDKEKEADEAPTNQPETKPDPPEIRVELALIKKTKKERKLVQDEVPEDSRDQEPDPMVFPLQSESEEHLQAGERDEQGEIDLTAIELEAIFTAKKIHELSAKGIEYKDIAILFRSVRGKADIFEKILAGYGIPSYVDYSASHYDKLEIKCLIDYLKVVDNRKQDEALLGAMSSAFGNFDNEELIRIRERYPRGNFYLAAENYAKNMEDELAEKLKRFYKTLSEDVRREKMTALPDFVWHVAENSGFNTYISGLGDSMQRLHNIRSLVQKSKEYDESEALGLFGFLRHMDSILKGKGDSGESTLLETENVVKIMSIHKSKGLEFDTVFVCDLAKQINEQDLNDDVILHNELGIGLRYKNPQLNIRSDNALRMVLRRKKQREGMSEEIRVLYVALTRAKNRLFLVGTIKDPEDFATKLSKGEIAKNILKPRSYLNWIANVLIRDQDGEELRRVSSEEVENVFEPEKRPASSSPLYRIVFVDGDRLVKEEPSQEAEDLREKIADVEISEAIRERLDRYNHFVYPYAEATKMRSKTSVTELTKEYKNREREDANSFSAIKRPSFTKSSRFSSTELGTIVHFLMENIPIRSYTLEALEQEIRRMIELELLTEAEAEAIPRQAVIGFFDSDLGQRMIASPKVYREQIFLMKQGDALVEGVIDCYFAEGDELVILDYKTDSRIDLEKHRLQLEYYRQAVEAMEGKRVKEGYIYWISHDRFSQIL